MIILKNHKTKHNTKLSHFWLRMLRPNKTTNPKVIYQILLNFNLLIKISILFLTNNNRFQYSTNNNSILKITVITNP
jgi:hypothetical protein